MSMNPQPELPGVPEQNPPLGAGSSPFAYTDPATASALLLSRWGFTANITEGLILAASMAVDEEGPFMGVKVSPEQEREFPRAFRYGWPNIIAAPSPVMVSLELPGAWMLNYDGVIPQQIVDWVVLEAYRYTIEDLDKVVVTENVVGASVKYGVWNGAKGSFPAVLDKLQAALLSPFLLRQARQNPFLNFSGI